MTFEREERIAFARIISDLIEADFIVEEGEMESFDKIKNEKDFNITMSMLSEAKTKTFEEAVSTLQALRNEEKKTIIKEKLYDMSLSDGTCVPLEALQIMAVNSALEGKGQVFSIPSGSSFIENMKVLYIENEDNTKTDVYIRSHYRAISNEFRLAGFHFVYIPQIVEDYRQIRGEYLRKVIKYMIPALEEMRVEKIQHDLCSMTTSRFSHELLFKKMGINMLNSKPAFLFKIGESSVADKSGVDDMERNMYSNFLLIPIDNMREPKDTIPQETILDHVVNLMDSYRSMVSGNLIIENQPLSKKFLYYGFHRSLFELIAFGKDKFDYKLVVNLESAQDPVFLRPVHVQGGGFNTQTDLSLKKLSVQERALFIQMVYASLKEKGLDWTQYNPKGEEYARILKINNAIYTPLAKSKKNTKYRDKTHVSHIVASLKSLGKVVTNIDRFIPQKHQIGKLWYYQVPLPIDSVYMIEGEEGNKHEVPISQSEFWDRMEHIENNVRTKRHP